MSEFIVPDKISVVETDGGTLHLHEGYDIIHRWNRIGFHLLKFWNQNTEPPCMQNIAIDAAGADFLHEQARLAIVDRDIITAHEHEIYIRWQSEQLETLFSE